MQSSLADGLLDSVMAFSGFAALLLALLNAAAYGITEGKGGPYVKQMVACLAAVAVFILSGLAKIIRCVV